MFWVLSDLRLKLKSLSQANHFSLQVNSLATQLKGAAK